MRILRFLGKAIAYLIGLVAVAWASAALWFGGPQPHWLASALAASVALAGIVLLVTMPAVRASMALTVMVGGIALWWSSLTPSNDRDWQPDVAELASADLQGDILTIHNVRNFDYRTETYFHPHWETRTYDLRDLVGADMFLSFWGPTAIAHTIASWEFSGGRHLAISIETRKEVGESYDPLRSLFRGYELYYVVADERDVIGVRANQRGEHVHLYRIRLPRRRARAILLDYLAEVNALVRQPRWYNGLTQNCTTTIREHVRHVMPTQPWDWRLLANGYIDQLWYERGVIDTSLPFAELKARSDVTERAKAAAHDPKFSTRIRQGLPKPSPLDQEDY